ncbi:MAG: T9SS type A sorting domain-containing protein [Ignavibacteriales bacterium]|nr:MAG: T9SS type A sorting domain-containing protein [Ignavibacteriaceae bacterium]MBW7872964.1 T9SS type A sorting domain-containing protein [Ignavibacteria bacterium]MCZ2142407.1 T9SS type A sorting domain-containing protein [Ignavibacteriales bacterium]MBV6445290.1 hypothetical protein [Ignavibacteriaceae bacterium]MBZ0198085.1 T9SS type A sorting domain-containing protein [Ignavibacteriaceae bacterium]
MKKAIYYLSVFFTVTAMVTGGVLYSTGETGATTLNGDGCVCHGPDMDPSVNVKIWGPAEVTPGSTNNYIVSIKGGPAVKGGFNTAVRFGSLSVTDAGVQKIADELTHNSARSFGAGDSVSWAFSYTAPGSEGYDTIYAVGNSVNGNGNPAGDAWNFAPNFAVHISQVVPVEFVSFTASAISGSVVLEWSTATETNNSRFEIEKMVSNSWKTIGTVKGNGTTTKTSHYSFTDKNATAGVQQYRLKQIDYSGAFEYSAVVKADVSAPNEYSLAQNYPNPFNPETVISFSLPEAANAKLTVFSLSGEKVAELVNSELPAGAHTVKFSAAALPSGVYFYRLEAGNISLTKKMILSK